MRLLLVHDVTLPQHTKDVSVLQRSTTNLYSSLFCCVPGAALCMVIRSLVLLFLCRLQSQSMPAALPLAYPARRAEWELLLAHSAVKWAVYICSMMF